MGKEQAIERKMNKSRCHWKRRNNIKRALVSFKRRIASSLFFFWGGGGTIHTVANSVKQWRSIITITHIQ